LSEEFKLLILGSAGLGNLVVKTEDEYVDKAVELASDVPFLASLRLGLREKMLKSYLCDGPKFVKGLEEKYRQLWHRYCDGGDIPFEVTNKAEKEALVSRSASTTGDVVTDMSMKEAGTAAPAPNTAAVTPTPSPTSTLSTTEGNSLSETRTKCQKRSPSSLDQPS
jgi:protein O-GlcNAc transferase